MRHTVLFALVATLVTLIFTRDSMGQQAVLVRDDPKQFAFTGNGASKADANIVDVAGQPFSKAWHVKVREKVGADYNVQFICKPAETLNVGDVVLVTAYARMIDSADESGEGRVSFVL